MSFTSNIKNEISSIQYSESENFAELSAILNIGAKIFDDRFEIYTENISVARRIYSLIKETYHIDIEMDNSEIVSEYLEFVLIFLILFVKKYYLLII